MGADLRGSVASRIANWRSRALKGISSPWVGTPPEKAQLAWSVVALDDCDECGDLRVELTLEEAGRPGAGLVAHLSPSTARRLRDDVDVLPGAQQHHYLPVIVSQN